MKPSHIWLACAGLALFITGVLVGQSITINQIKADTVWETIREDLYEVADEVEYPSAEWDQQELDYINSFDQ